MTKYTGVLAEDVLFSMWKTEPFKPVHYLAIDRGAKRIVISIR